jgi:hypothetical protein
VTRRRFLIEALRTQSFPKERCFAWAALESQSARAVRRYLVNEQLGHMRHPTPLQWPSLRHLLILATLLAAVSSGAAADAAAREAGSTETFFGRTAAGDEVRLYTFRSPSIDSQWRLERSVRLLLGLHGGAA